MRFVVFSVATVAALAPFHNEGLEHNQAVDAQYVVALKVPDIASTEFIEDHLQRVFGMESALVQDGPVLHKYQFGYAAKMSDELLENVRLMSEVDFVEPDYIGQLYESQRNPASWGLKRISSRKQSRSNVYSYPDHAGNGSTVYVLDTGIDIYHQDFQGRAVWGKNFVSRVDVDDNGHGTHVAGTVAGREFGVAKKATVVAMKVCDGYGRCPLSGVIAGIELSIKMHKESGSKNVGLGNMSLGWYGTLRAMRSALEAAFRNNFLMVVASGNSYDDACGYSPAQFNDIVLSVNAMESTDKRAYFSNYGNCTSVFAPGVKIVSAKPYGGSATMSGTSMASPHVAGLAALVAASEGEWTTDSIHKHVIDTATKGVVQNAGPNSPNLLIYVEQEEDKKFTIQKSEQ